MAKSQLRVKQMFPSITSYKHQNELEKLVLVNRPSFQNNNFNQFQSFQVCPSFSPFVFAMILLRYDTTHFSSFHVLSSYLHSTHVQYTQTDTIRQTHCPLVPIENDVIPMVLLVNMHLIQMVRWYQWYDWYQ